MFVYFNLEFFHDSMIFVHMNLCLDCTFFTLYSKINMIYEVCLLTFVLTYQMITRFMLMLKKNLEFINN